MERIRHILKWQYGQSDGILYLSFKHGNCERTENGRYFNDLDEVALRSLFSSDPRLEILKVWISEDVRNERRGNQQWLNALARRRDLDAR